MTEVWIALLLYTNSLNAQILQEFASEKTCWDYYAGDQSFGKQLDTHQDKIRLFTNRQTKELMWLTCELQANLDYSKRRYPLNILLPTPV